MPKASRREIERVREIVLGRDQNTCQRCGINVLYKLASVQHRIARGRGGSAAERIWSPANLALLCGSATTPDGCHNLVENEDRDRGKWEGWVLPMNNPSIDPAREPALTYRGWVLYDNDGGWDLAPVVAV
jgi:hypothetical protein